jgi:predicted transcriptional regulator
VVNRKDYAQHVLKDTFKSLFNGSLNQLVSTFVKSKDISITELEELKDMLEKEIRNKKQ